MILKVNSPTDEEMNMIKGNSSFLSFFQTMKETNKVKILQDKNVTAYSMHLIPRTTLAQKMDALSSQTNIAGYKAVLIASCHIEKYMPLLMTAAGTIPPAKVLVLGAGVAGLSAIATAKRLGAQVEASDVRPEVKEQVESLGAKFLEVKSDSDDGVGEGGYAKETSDEYKKKQAELLNERIAASDIVVTTALIPGRPAPILISDKMVKSMSSGSVIMDLASENGGNCSLTEPDKIIDVNGVIIDGTVNLAGTMSVHASQLYAKNVSAFILHAYNKDEKKFDLEDEIVSGSMFTHNGEIVDERTKSAIEGAN
jgi:NAD(P) transhydrogenase subunit alpha